MGSILDSYTKEELEQIVKSSFSYKAVKPLSIKVLRVALTHKKMGRYHQGLFLKWRLA